MMTNKVKRLDNAIARRHIETKPHYITGEEKQTAINDNGENISPHPTIPIKVQGKFWTNASGSLRFDPEALHEFLKENGYGILKSEGLEGAILIKVEGRIVKNTTSREIRDFCWRYIGEKYEFKDADERKQVKNLFYKEASLFSYNNLLLMPAIALNEIADTANESYLFFKNCILKVTPEEIEKLKYEDIKGHVFEKDIINFDLATENVVKNTGDFQMFIFDICTHDNDETEANNLQSLMSIIGYMLHRFKDPSKAKAVILMDPYKGEGANGGTGKSLLTKAFDKVRPTVYEDGKFFHTKDRFALGQVNYNTRILVIDDIAQDFNFSKLFPLITEKAVVERKYQNKYTILFERSPKIIITTNYWLKATDESSNRRKMEFVLADFYDAELTPETKYGNLFFIDWDNEEWEYFYLFMAYCLWQYLKDGIIEQKFNIAERTLKMTAHPKFIEFVKGHVNPSVKFNKRIVYNQFYTQNPNVGNVELTTFTRWLRLYADAFGYVFNESHSGSENFFEYSKE
ncbi:MAG: hypothetical protein JXB49_14125 [Bacteroidales bacterium]|nr:hypothetical protein [Bacteroidales bacterium]